MSVCQEVTSLGESSPNPVSGFTHTGETDDFDFASSFSLFLHTFQATPDMDQPGALSPEKTQKLSQETVPPDVLASEEKASSETYPPLATQVSGPKTPHKAHEQAFLPPALSESSRETTDHPSSVPLQEQPVNQDAAPRVTERALESTPSDKKGMAPSQKSTKPLASVSRLVSPEAAPPITMPTVSSAPPLVSVASISPSFLLSQVTTALQGLTHTGPSENTTLELTLIPQELGRLTIEMNFEGPNMEALFHGNTHTLQLLKTHQHLLIETLSHQGIAVKDQGLSFGKNNDPERETPQPDPPTSAPWMGKKAVGALYQRLKEGIFA
ncbi:flagellar hook-length control protein FliK [Candidatus Hepatobacter penaei]|uniref:flagellar hook-length control protein FliK n=1 Tax=Candidatus Hepatobacter penaei TaxID=1274402 RepID=UPI0004F37601|nr:flagellar hook-length control protein FliK [Candidatus Hepatobacter penaei]